MDLTPLWYGAYKAAKYFLYPLTWKLVLTGGDATVYRTGPPVSHAMKRWALRLGVSESVILLEEQSRTTYENALYTKTLLGPSHILLVTDAYHMPRAAGLFEKQGFAGFESTHRPQDAWKESTMYDFIPTVNAMQVTTQAIDEAVGIIVYWIAGKW